MILVDTSVWIEIFNDKTGNIVKAFKKDFKKISRIRPLQEKRFNLR